MQSLLKYLPGPQPPLVRYGATIVFVLIAYGFRVALGEFSGAYGFLFFILPIVASALMFDRGTGFFAVALSSFLVASLLRWDVKPGAHIIALILFVIVGACLVLISEGLHRALEQAHAAQRATALLLDEMSHRVKNKFSLVASMIALQARRSPPEVRPALDDIARRVTVITTLHDHIGLSRRDGAVDMSEYLPKLCGFLKDGLLAYRPILLKTTVEPIIVPTDKALAIGVIANELLTNAAKYAFDEDVSGTIVVDLRRDREALVLTVTDDGRGSPADSASGSGLGSRLVNMFAEQHGGTATWSAPATGGTSIVVEIPS